MSPRGVLSTPRTVSAIQKADALPRNMIPGPYKRSTPPVSAGAGTEAYPCKITGSPSGGAYPVDVHKDGKTETKTGTGDIQVLQLHISETLPTDTWLMGFDTTLANYNEEE